MQCLSCSIEIPPVWKTCLAENKCPSCGKEIMNSQLQELIIGLTGALEKMPNNPQGVACWIVSNYNLTKIADYEPPKFHDPKLPAALNNSPAEKQDKVAEFFRRAQAPTTHKKIPPQVVSTQDDDVNEDVEDIDEIDKMIMSNSQGSISDDEKSEIEAAIMGAKYGAERNPAVAAMIEAQKQRQEDIANGIGATDKFGRPAGFRRAD